MPLWNTERSAKQKDNKEITSLNDTLDQLNIIGIYEAFHSKTAAYTFFSTAHGTVSRINLILGQKESLNNRRGVKSYQLHSLIRML